MIEESIKPKAGQKFLPTLLVVELRVRNAVSITSGLGVKARRSHVLTAKGI